MKFKHLKSGIVQLIINTPERWMEYQTFVTFKKDINGQPIPEQQFTIEISNSNYDGEFGISETLNIDFDFDYKKYHKLEEQEKDQIVVYFVPKDMLL